MRTDPFRQYSLDMTLMAKANPIIDLPKPGSTVSITNADGSVEKYSVNVAARFEPVDLYFTDPDLPLTLPVAAMRRRARRKVAHVRISAAVLGFILGVVAGLWIAAAVFHLAR